MCALFNKVLVERYLTLPLSRYSGVILVPARSLMKSSAVELIVARSCYRGAQYVCRS